MYVPEDLVDAYIEELIPGAPLQCMCANVIILWVGQYSRTLGRV